MNRTTLLFLIIMLVLPVFMQAAIKTMSTDKFMVYYYEGMEDEALHALQVLEYYRPQLEKLTGNTYPQAAIVLEDMGNLVNGFANPVGNVIGLYMYPPTDDELSVGLDWFQTVAPHEYIHQLQLSHEAGVPALLRTIFGNLLYVQMHQPMWMTEGITVYGESQLSANTGRMNGAYYSAIISALAREDKLPSPTKASYYSSDTPLAHYYVFGGSFHKYLAAKYGEDKFRMLYMDNSSRITAYSNGVSPALALDPAFLNTYGMSLSSLWSDWQHAQKNNLNDIIREQITEDGWNKDNLQHHNNALYYTQLISDKTGPGRFFSSSRIMRLDLANPSAKAETVIDQASDFPAGYHFAGNRLYYSRKEYRRGFANKSNDGFGSITQILMHTNSANTIIYEGQVRAFLPLIGGSILISEDLPLYRGSVLFEYDPDAGSKRVIYEGEELIHAICMNQDEIYLGAKAYWSNSNIYRLQQGSLVPVIDSPHKETLLCANDGKLFFNSVEDDKLLAFIYNTQSKQRQIVQHNDYLKDPVFSGASEFYYLSPNAKGMDIYKAPLVYEDVPKQDLRREPILFPKSKFFGQSALADGTPIRHGDYSLNIAHMINPRMLRIPQIYGTQDSLAVGAVLVGADAVGDFPLWQIAAVYDTYRQKIIGDFQLSSHVLNPLNQDLMISSDEDLTITLHNSICLLRRQNYGITEINTGLGLQAKNRFERNKAYPFISQQLVWKYGQAGVRNTLYWESSGLNLSNRDRLGWQGQLVVRQKCLINSELNSTLNIAYDPDADFDEVFYPIRGYDKELYANKGITLRNTLYKPLLKIRQGTWNPQIYLEDINLGFFYDMAMPQTKAAYIKQYSYGIELIAEIGLAFMDFTNVGFRYSTNKESERTLSLIMDIGL